MSRHEVGVQVRLKNVADLQAVFPGCFEINFHIALWIDYNSLPLRPQQVRRMRQTAKVELFKVHRMASIRSTPQKCALEKILRNGDEVYFESILPTKPLGCCSIGSSTCSDS